jgi:hypothetical protein
MRVEYEGRKMQGTKTAYSKLGVVEQVYNRSYLWGRDQEDYGLKPVLAKKKKS